MLPTVNTRKNVKKKKLNLVNLGRRPSQRQTARTILWEIAMSAFHTTAQLKLIEMGIIGNLITKETNMNTIFLWQIAKQTTNN